MVSALQIALADKVGAERFELWFGANTRLSLSSGALTVGVPNQFLQEWLRNNFRREIEAACCETLGRPVPVSFHIDPLLAAAASPRRSATARGGGAEAAAIAKTDAARSFQPTPGGVGAADKSSAEKSGTRRRFASLDTFVVGAGNRLAHLSAQAVVSRLGTTSPLLVHGPTGAGKTHLLEGIWIAAKKAQPALHAVYLSAEQFTTYFLEALHGSGLPNFRRKYRGVELLIVDDLHFFAGKRATLIELLHTIDTLGREGRQLVFAADRAPGALGELGPELVARLQGGLCCAIEPPEFETRRGIVRQLSKALEVDVPAEVQDFVAANVDTHARALCGALNQLQAASQAHGRPVTLALADEALAELIRSQARAVRLPDIEAAVCDVFGLEPSSLQSGRKGKLVDHPRMLAMWLARKHTRAALSEIGQYFGRRSHTTVISAQKRVNRWMADGAPLAVSDRSCKVEEAIRRVEEALRAG